MKSLINEFIERLNAADAQNNPQLQIDGRHEATCKFVQELNEKYGITGRIERALVTTAKTLQAWGLKAK